MSLMKPFHALADRWVEEQQKINPTITLKTLGTRALGAAKTFDRLEAGGYLSVPVYEKVIDFLYVGANWPGGEIPADALQSLMLIRHVQQAA